jgi:hypothetical protein
MNRKVTWRTGVVSVITGEIALGILFLFFGSVVSRSVVGAAASEPSTALSNDDNSLAATEPTILDCTILQPASAVKGLQGPWPKVLNEPETNLVDEREGVITVEIPDGRRYAQLSNFTSLTRYNDLIVGIAISPLVKAKPLDETSRAVDELLGKWKVVPTGSFKAVLEEMKRAIPNQGKPWATDFRIDGQPQKNLGKNPPAPGYWVGDQGMMLLSADTELGIYVQKVFASEGLYTVTIRITVARAWFANHPFVPSTVP